jgi:1-aminocyclopropane-1-carboxylate deaminase/D-cysteine desulfhydrase-like pyridoxal-dependent ACC family enzyme
MARTCNEFRVQNELEFNFVRGACVLGGTLSGLIYSFSEGQCDSGKAVALCRVAIQGTDLEEVTWYLEPEKQLGEPGSHENKFKASCDQLGGVFYKLNP